MGIWANILLAFSFLVCVVYGEECLCKLQPSATYEGTMEWNCQNIGLHLVPTQCFNQSTNVTELILSNNVIESIQAHDFSQLPFLKALFLDVNRIEFFDEAALQPIPKLEIFSVAQNPNIQFPLTAFANDKKLSELYFISSNLGVLPGIIEDTELTTLDARSCLLTTLPRPLFGDLESDNFYLNFFGNKFVDVAADILLPMANFSVINFDSYVIIWAEDEQQYNEVLNKQWQINLDLHVSLKVCGVDGTPVQNPAMC